MSDETPLDGREEPDTFLRPISPEARRRARLVRLGRKGQALGWCPVCGRGDVALKPYSKATGELALACADEQACCAATATRPVDPGEVSPLWRSDEAGFVAFAVGEAHRGE